MSDVNTLGRLLEEGLRRVLDLLISSLLLIALLPLLLLLGVLIRLSSPGPVFFKQQRVGRAGCLFSLYKFRSMRPAVSGPLVTAGNDKRITPIGRWLRQWKLDELPQFLNVLRGEMSLVGPRPEVPRYVQHYTDTQRQVLAVRPGITGVCQIEFRHEEALLAGREDAEAFYLSTIMPAKLALDLEYLRNRTLAGDLYLLFRTLRSLFLHAPSPMASKPSETASKRLET